MGKRIIKRAAVGLMLLLVGGAAFPEAQSREHLPHWRPVGPAGLFNGSTLLSGRVDVAVSDPRDANVMYVGAGDGGGNGGGGIWKTTNYLTTDPAGPTWVPVTDNFPSLSILGKSLALYPDNPDVLYAAVNGPNGGILKTTDAGEHWQYLLSDVFSSALFSALVIHPSDPNVVYVAVPGNARGGSSIAGGVYRLTFTQTGATWMNLTSDVAPGSVATDVVVDPTHPEVLYAGLVMATSPRNNGLYKSVDGGKNWRQLTNVVLSGDNVGEWISLAIAGPSSPETLYTTVFQRDNSSETPMLQRFLTTDAGTSWSMLNPPASISDFRSAHVVLAVDPNSPTVVYANAHPEHLFVSTDSGQNWTVIPQLQDPVNVYFDSAGEVTYVTDQGINRVLHPHDPDQTSLVHKQGNLGNFLFYNVTLDPRNPHSGFGISQDHIPMLQFTGQPTWISAQAGNEVGKVLIDPHDPDVVYNRSPAPPWGGFVQRSTDGGMHWHRISHGIDMSEFSTALPSQPPNNAFALDEHQPSRLVLGGTRVWQTLNRGDDWSPISHVLSPTGGTDGEPATITAIAVAPSQGDTMYAATEDGRFFATFDGGRSN